MKKIKISDYIYNKVIDFAEERIEGSAALYKYRGESKIPKMKEDCEFGCLGEWGVYKFLRSKGIKVSKPDMKIYTGRRKSFDADLTTDKFKIHVKSQGENSARLYGHSWLLQRSDKVVKEPKDNEYFAFTKVTGKEVEILGFVKASDLADYDLYGECKVPFFRKTKVALYLDDISEYVKRSIK